MKKIALALLISFCFLASHGLAKGMAFQGKPGKQLIGSDSAEPQLRVHRRGNINFSVTNWGFLGSQARDLDESTGCLFCDHPDEQMSAPSFEFPSNSGLEYLFQGALWIGGVVEGETLVSVGADGWFWIYELWPSSNIEESDLLGGRGLHGQECVSIFTDTTVPPPLTIWSGYGNWDQREHKPLNIEVIEKSYSWESPPYDDFVILDYTIRNIGDKLISDVYLGLFLDPDIFGLDLYSYAPE